MDNEELIADIQSRLQRGQRSIEIKQDLIKRGWAEKEIDDAMSYIHRLVLKQIPVVSSVINFWEAFEVRVANMSPRAAVIALITLAFSVFLIGAALYLALDPLNTKSESRDAQRATTLAELQTALGNYFVQKQVFPTTLSQLVPDYIQSVPKDPRSGEEYSYRLLSDQNYELCVKFEAKPVACYSAADTVQESQFTMTDVPENSENLDNLLGLSINGFIFMDKNNDKIQQKNEDVTVSAIVRVADKNGNEVCMEVTDTQGMFTCEVQKPGDYYVLLDSTASFEVLGANPQKVTLPDPNNLSEKSARVTLRTSPVSAPVSSAPTAQ